MSIPTKTLFGNKFILICAFSLAIAIWILAFLPFLTSDRALYNDALSYYNQTKYYLDNLSKGIIPLWNPFENYGAPNNLFLQRIGSYNPALLLILFLRVIGLSHVTAYLIFLASYFLLGMIGFYFISKKFLGNSALAFCSFLLLTFSSLATMLFDSYLHLIYVPQIWFFFFLISFLHEPKPKWLIGCFFSAMILATSYIPFYFLTILITFSIALILVFPSKIKPIAKRLTPFFKTHKILTFLLIIALTLAIIPGIQLVKSAKNNDFVMPRRHAQALTENPLTLNNERGSQWAIIEEIIYSTYFADFRHITYSVVYLPLMALIFFGLGLITRINRKLLFLLVWGFQLILIGTPSATPIYYFLSKHIFFFKYFKNLHFFIWLALLPIFILFITEQLRQFLNLLRNTNNRIPYLIFLIFIHSGLAAIYYSRQVLHPIIYTTILLSFCTFTLFLFKRELLFKNRWFASLMIVFVIILQPFFAYSHFCKNADPKLLTQTYFFDLKDNVKEMNDRRPYPLSKEMIKERIANDSRDYIWYPKPAIYFANKFYNILYETLATEALENYLASAFKIYDTIRIVPEESIDFKELQSHFIENYNQAWITPNPSDTLPLESLKELRNPLPSNQEAININPHTDRDDFKITYFDANTLKLKTNFQTTKFLVYNDTFNEKWKAQVNGSPTQLWRSNYAFKGVLLPAGENTVVFRYGESFNYTIHLLNLFSFLSVFLLFLFYQRKPKTWIQKNV